MVVLETIVFDCNIYENKRALFYIKINNLLNFLKILCESSSPATNVRSMVATAQESDQ